MRFILSPPSRIILDGGFLAQPWQQTFIETLTCGSLHDSLLRLAPSDERKLRILPPLSWRRTRSSVQAFGLSESIARIVDARAGWPAAILYSRSRAGGRDRDRFFRIFRVTVGETRDIKKI